MLIILGVALFAFFCFSIAYLYFNQANLFEKSSDLYGEFSRLRHQEVSELRGRLLRLEHDFEELQAQHSQLQQDFRSLVAATLPTPTQLAALESRLTRKLAETDKLTRKDIKELFNRSRRLRLRRV